MELIFTPAICFRAFRFFRSSPSPFKNLLGTEKLQQAKEVNAGGFSVDDYGDDYGLRD